MAVSIGSTQGGLWPTVPFQHRLEKRPLGALVLLAAGDRHASDLGLLGNLQGIIDFDAKVPDCTFNSMDFRT